jgi:hypothetical protein
MRRSYVVHSGIRELSASSCSELMSLNCLSLINVLFWWKSCMYEVSQHFIRVSLLHGFSSCNVSTKRCWIYCTMYSDACIATEIKLNVFFLLKYLSKFNGTWFKIFYLNFIFIFVLTVPANMFDMHSFGHFDLAFMSWFTGDSLCHYVLQQESIQKLIHSTDLHFDVVIVGAFFNECFLGFAHKFQAPIIQVCTYGGGKFMAD